MADRNSRSENAIYQGVLFNICSTFINKHTQNMVPV